MPDIRDHIIKGVEPAALAQSGLEPKLNREWGELGLAAHSEFIRFYARKCPICEFVNHLGSLSCYSLAQNAKFGESAICSRVIRGLFRIGCLRRTQNRPDRLEHTAARHDRGPIERRR